MDTLHGTLMLSLVQCLPGQVINAIMGPWMDLNPNNGGGLYYNVYGVAPFRRFVASFENFGYFSCAGLQFNGQIKIFETTNVMKYIFKISLYVLIGIMANRY